MVRIHIPITDIPVYMKYKHASMTIKPVSMPCQHVTMTTKPMYMPLIMLLSHANTFKLQCTLKHAHRASIHDNTYLALK